MVLLSILIGIILTLLIIEIIKISEKNGTIGLILLITLCVFIFLAFYNIYQSYLNKGLNYTDVKYQIFCLIYPGMLVGDKRKSKYLFQIVIRELIVLIILYSSQIYNNLQNNFNIPEIDSTLVLLISVGILIVDFLPTIRNSKITMLHDLLLDTDILKAD